MEKIVRRLCRKWKVHNGNLELINYNGIILLYKGRHMSIENLYVGQVSRVTNYIGIRQFGNSTNLLGGSKVTL